MFLECSTGGDDFFLDSLGRISCNVGRFLIASSEIGPLVNIQPLAMNDCDKILTMIVEFIMVAGEAIGCGRRCLFKLTWL